MINRTNTDVPCYIDFDTIDSRNKIIQQNSTEGSIPFWIDGLGAEWIPVLLSRLNALGIAVAEHLECDCGDLEVKIEEFKEQGCTLFL